LRQCSDEAERIVDIKTRGRKKKEKQEQCCPCYCYRMRLCGRRTGNFFN
jgi:hypothetical protein